MTPASSMTATPGGAETDMEDVAPTDPNGTNGITAVTNQFSILSTVEEQLTAAEPLTKGSEEKTETPEEKKARNQKDNSDRSRSNKATAKVGTKLERKLTKLLVAANYNKEAISVNLDNMKATFFSLQWNTQDVQDELRRLMVLPPATAWEAISGTMDVAGGVGEVLTKKRSRPGDRVNYKETESGDEHDYAEEEGARTPTSGSPLKKQPKERGKAEVKQKAIFSLSPQIPNPTPQTSPKKNILQLNGGSTQ